MEGLSCQCCRGISSEFTILKCDHVVCAECLWGEIKTTLNGLNSIRCSCGQTTTFPSTKSMLSSKITHLTSSIPNPTRHTKNDSQSLFIRSPSTPTRERRTTVEKSANGQLNCELQFLGVQYRKSLDQAQKNFRKVLDCLKTKYENLIRNIRLFWLQEMVEIQPCPLLDLPRLLKRKYQKSVGNKIQRINQVFLQALASYRLETAPEERPIFPRSSVYGKQNHEEKNKFYEQRSKILKVMEELKERGIKKVGRKTQKYKFI